MSGAFYPGDDCISVLRGQGKSEFHLTYGDSLAVLPGGFDLKTVLLLLSDPPFDVIHVYDPCCGPVDVASEAASFVRDHATAPLR